MCSRSISIAAFAAVFAALLFAKPVLGGPPLPGESWADPCIALCPKGDLIFHLHGFRNGSPVEAWPVEVDFCAAPGVRLAPTTGAEPYQIILGCRVSVFTGADGVGVFAIKAGGVARDVHVEVTSPLVLAVRSAVVSPDQNGDLQVDPSDVAIAEAKLGSADPTADLDCDGAVTAADLNLLRDHLGHAAAGPIAVQGKSWQGIKGLFRN